MSRIVETVSGRTVIVNRAAGFVVVGNEHQEQLDRPALVSRIAMYRDLAGEDPDGRFFNRKSNRFYTGILAACRRALVVLDGEN